MAEKLMDELEKAAQIILVCLHLIKLFHESYK